jgi:uncharacterized membrane protein
VTLMSPATRQRRDVALLWGVSAGGRVLIVAGVGGVAGFVAAWFAPWQLSTLVGWDVAAALFLVWVGTTAGRFNTEDTHAFATREDDSRVSAGLLLVGAGVASLLGVGFDLTKASQANGGGKAMLTLGAVLTVVLSWAVVQFVFALRYADEFYTAPIGGIDFKAEREYAPDYRDFAYVAFTVGMTFQVSDTDIQIRIIRRTVMTHALLSYLFGAVILAVTINVIAALFQ